MPSVEDTFRELQGCLDPDVKVRASYEKRIASRDLILDVGGRNSNSKSAKRLRTLAAPLQPRIVSTDLVADYSPDVVDDITNSHLPDESHDAVYCDAILEHVHNYEDAVAEIHRLLRDGGEAFFYVPFMYGFHDAMDYHRFTLTELARMLRRFSEVRVFVPDNASGFGFVLWHVMTYGAIGRLPAVHAVLTRMTNALLRAAIRITHRIRRPEHTLEEALFFYTYVTFNHGFCAWVRK